MIEVVRNRDFAKLFQKSVRKVSEIIIEFSHIVTRPLYKTFSHTAADRRLKATTAGLLCVHNLNNIHGDS